jgi:DNA modification methylase
MKIYNMDCQTGMAENLPESSIDSIITDPPYELGFMGKAWDHTGISYSPALWKEALRVLKPGGHLLAFGGTRTYHRMVCAIEDAGFEIRDQLQWIYGNGFPKGAGLGPGVRSALKPANEPIVLARKPPKGSLKDNVHTYGVGGLNITDCRIGTDLIKTCAAPKNNSVALGRGWSGKFSTAARVGRYPSNVLLDNMAAAMLDEQTGVLKSGTVRPEGFKGSYTGTVFGKYTNNTINPDTVYGDSGGASRFFYCAKATRKERGKGNLHPTVKPIKLMQYLVRLITPPGGTVLDPFLGSGTTALACLAESRDCIGFEQNEAYCHIAESRIDAAVDTILG